MLHNRTQRLLDAQHDLKLPQVNELFGKKGLGFLDKLELAVRWVYVEAALVSIGCNSYFGALYKKKRATGKKANTSLIHASPV